MHLSDIIDTELSLYNFLGKTAGTALPYKGKESRTKMANGPLTVWRRKAQINEVRSNTGTGLGGSGATMHPGSGPAELEYDLTKVDDEFKGKDTRADIKKSKEKRMTLKRFLQQRTDREVDRVEAGAL